MALATFNASTRIATIRQDNGEVEEKTISGPLSPEAATSLLAEAGWKPVGDLQDKGNGIFEMGISAL